MLSRQQNILRLEAASIPMKPMILNVSTFSTSIPLPLIRSIGRWQSGIYLQTAGTTPTPTVTPPPTEVPDETPAASQEITPAEPTSNAPLSMRVRQTPVVTPRVESKRSTPSLTVKKQSKQQILRIVLRTRKRSILNFT